MSMWDLLVNYFKREWSVIRSAPLLVVVIFAGGAAGGAYIAWCGTKLWYSQDVAYWKQAAGFYPAYTEYSNLINGELKDVTAEFVQDLSQFSVEYYSAMGSSDLVNCIVSSETQKCLLEYQQAIEPLNVKFNAVFRPKAINLETELLKRISKQHRPDLPSRARIAIDYGLLHGANPIGDLTTYLQGLADRLAE